MNTLTKNSLDGSLIIKDLSLLGICGPRVIIRGISTTFSKKTGEEIKEEFFTITGNPEDERISKMTIISDLITFAFNGKLRVNSETKSPYIIEAINPVIEQEVRKEISRLVPWIERNLKGKIHPILNIKSKEDFILKNVMKGILKISTVIYLYSGLQEGLKNKLEVEVVCISDGVKIHQYINRLTLPNPI